MVTDADIEKILEKLPEMIKKNPELAYRFYRVLKEEFATVTALRDYMEQSDRQFRELLQTVKEGFKRMDERFEAVDQRFDAVDKRFEASDKRFETLITEMNQRFDAVDKRFEASNKRFETLITEMNQRFDAVDKRFDASDKRFETLITEMNQRFDASNKRFDVMATELMKIKVGIGTLGRKAGDDFERVILTIYKNALAARGIDISEVEKKGVSDKLGELYHPGAKVQVDMYAHDGEHVLFEIKYTADEEDVEVFFRKAQFIEKKLGIVAQKTFIAIDIDERALNLCRKLGISVVTG